jgi:hypothetical protein
MIDRDEQTPARGDEPRRDRGRAPRRPPPGRPRPAGRVTLSQQIDPASPRVPDHLALGRSRPAGALPAQIMRSAERSELAPDALEQVTGIGSIR